jgi:Protein of unknown function (DUF2283)
MSESRSETPNYILDDSEDLTARYDDEADVLYLWRGDEAVEGVGLTTDEGIVILFNPDDGELVGFTLLDWRARWAGQEIIEISVPSVGATQPMNGSSTKHRVLSAATA